MMPAERRRRDPTPNLALRALLEESEWTQEAFARAISRLGNESGTRLGYDRTSVAHWLRGSRPSPKVQRFIAEALSRRLGRPVDVTRWVRVLDAYRGPSWTADQVSLVQSHLGEGPRRRPRYEVLETFPMGR